MCCCPIPTARMLPCCAEFRDGQTPPQLSLAFRLQRALRCIPVTTAALQTALTTTDNAALRIQTCQDQETQSGRILSAWERNNRRPIACNACRARTWCPDYPGR